MARDDAIERIDLLDENLYFATHSGLLIAIDAAVGTERWQRQVSREGREIFAPAHVDALRLRKEVWTDTVNEPPAPSGFDPVDVVAVNDLQHVMVIERRTGEIYRDEPFSFTKATSGGVCDRERFYYPGLNNTCVAKDLMLGEAVWWLSYDGLADVPIRYHADHAFVGTTDGQMKCIAGGPVGEHAWAKTFDGAILTPFHVDARGLFFAAGQQIRGHEPMTGLKLWEPVYVEGTIDGPMQLSQNTLYQYARGDGLYAINFVTGELRWKLPKGRKVLAVMDGMAYIIDENKTLHVTNEITGEVVATALLREFDYFVGNTTAPAIYAATRHGQFFCIRKQDAGRLTPEMMQSR
jgi:outer membrane protein assembly factor BamB